MKDIGCHFGFEYFEGNPYHKTNLFFSSGRNSLRYIIRERTLKYYIYLIFYAKLYQRLLLKKMLKLFIII